MITSATDVVMMTPTVPQLLDRFKRVREQTEKLAAPLPIEDQVVQTMGDVSPTKWHLGHTTWFFETVVLRRFLDDYEVFRRGFDTLFNSYYRRAGTPFPRHRRGTLGRPTVATIRDYRAHVDAAMKRLFEDDSRFAQWAAIAEVGLHHERQHQELILTDIKHVLANNPLSPSYREIDADDVERDLSDQTSEKAWLDIAGSTYEIGYEGSDFAFDNERPRHCVVLDNFEIASRPVSCGEFMEFIEDGGYDDSRWWLADGWQWAKDHHAKAPMYWQATESGWTSPTLNGLHPVDPAEPVCHVNYFEADAFARWAGARLPTEAEWEVASRIDEVEGNFLERDLLHPIRCDESDPAHRGGHRYFGDVWEWTSSPYAAYPGFQPWNGLLSEYNGKFMCHQFVLRGGCCVTPKELMRRSYRNFFPPHSRWQFSGFRLAR